MLLTGIKLNIIQATRVSTQEKLTFFNVFERVLLLFSYSYVVTTGRHQKSLNTNIYAGYTILTAT